MNLRRFTNLKANRIWSEGYVMNGSIAILNVQSSLIVDNCCGLASIWIQEDGWYQTRQ